jgi:hypothetical protein
MRASFDAIDPAERALARRVRALSDRAVVPIDPLAVAAAAAMAGRRSTTGAHLRGLLGRDGLVRKWAGVAAAVAVVAAVAIWSSPLGGRTPDAGTATATPTVAPQPTDSADVAMCLPDEVNARITAWGGAAGHRIATVELTNLGDRSCLLGSLPEPRLTDRRGNSLLVGAADPTAATLELRPGDIARTEVDVANYCGGAVEAPVMVAFVDDDRLLVATALSPSDLSGVPPCNGPSQPGTIVMQPWSR